MLRTLLTCFFVLVACSSAVLAADSLPDSQRLDLFLLIGQSNMAGRGKVEAQDKEVDPRVWTLDKSSAWRPATDPIHFDKSAAGVGLGRTFGIVIAEKRHTTVGLIPCAVGGTSIGAWKKGGKLYAEALRRAKIAMTHGTISGILWHQGEADSNDKGITNYMSQLTQLIADVRADLQAPEVPFICGQLGTFYAQKAPHCAELNKVLLTLPGLAPHTGCVSSDGLVGLSDNTHFDAASQREFGKRYAAEFLRLSVTAK